MGELPCPDELHVIVRPLTPARWAISSRCSRRVAARSRAAAGACSTASGGRRAAAGAPARQTGDAEGAVRAGPPPGPARLSRPRAVGWMTLVRAPSSSSSQRSPVMKPVDDAPVWSIVCFVVPSEFRPRGVARRLACAARSSAPKRGVASSRRIRSTSRSGRDDVMWHGAVSMFDSGGLPRSGAPPTEAPGRAAGTTCRRANLRSELCRRTFSFRQRRCPPPTSSPPSAPRAAAATAGCPAGIPSISPRRCSTRWSIAPASIPRSVDDVIMGCVSQVGEQAINVARNAVLASKLPERCRARRSTASAARRSRRCTSPPRR